MWVINPEGLPDSGKVAAVISSAFGSFSEACKKKKKREKKRERERRGKADWSETILFC